MSFEDHEVKREFKDYIGLFIYVLLAILIVLGFMSLRFAKSEAGKCIVNPVPSFIKYLELSSNSNVTCTCAFDKKNIWPIVITKDGMKTLK